MPPGRHEDGAPAGILAAAVLLSLALRLLFFSGLTGYDEFAYARIAADISGGAYNLPDVTGYYGFRYLVVFPAAFFLKLFGNSAHSLAVWPMLCSVGNTLLAYFLGLELSGRRAGVIAAFFQAFLPVSVIYGTMLYPEEILVFWTGLSALLFLKATAGPDSGKPALMFGLSGLCAGLGCHARLNSAVMLLVFAAWAFRSGFKAAHLSFAAGFLAALIPGFAAGWYLTGYAFFSLSSQLAKLAADTGIYPGGHLVYLRGLLGIDLYGLALFGPYFYFFLAAGATAFRRKEFSLFWLPLSWFTLLFLYFEFGPASLSPYQPVHKQLRFLSMAVFPVIVAAAGYVSALKPAFRAAAVLILLAGSSLAAWKMHAYREAEVAPYRSVAAWLETRSPGAVYASGSWGHYLGYYLKRMRGVPYYPAADRDGGRIFPLTAAADARKLAGACAVVDLPPAGAGLPPRLAALPKDVLEVNGEAGAYCFR